jgi:ssDNA-binding Zn-finger/Zn-ribbon topoisomerase 1
MSLKCSIFGHRFGDPVVERSRDESGSEVVITIQEIQTCGRCGQERVVSENKEVTTLETPDDDVPAESEPTQSEPAEQDTPPEPEPTPPADEGATILEDEDPVVEEAEPEQDAPTADDITEPPAEESAPAEDDGIILEEETEESAEPDREPGEWPEEPGDEEPEWAPPTEVEETAEPDPEPAPSVEPTGEAVTVPEGTFRCPNCGFTTPVESSSLREGDFCPECHTGTLSHESE